MVPPSEAQTHPTWTDLLRCYTHAHSGPGPCQEISELRLNFLKDQQPWSDLRSSTFASMSTAGSLLSYFQGKSSGAMRPSHTPILYMAFVQYHVSEDIFSCVGFLVREDFMLTAAHCLGR